MASKSDSKRMVCDCGRLATKISNGVKVCDFCFECERKGCCGGPKNMNGRLTVKPETEEANETTA